MNQKGKLSVILAITSVASVGFSGAFSSFAAYDEQKANEEIRRKISEASDIANFVQEVSNASGLSFEQMLERISSETGKIDISGLTDQQKSEIKRIATSKGLTADNAGDGFYSLKDLSGNVRYSARDLANWLKEGKNYVEPSNNNGSGSGDSGFVNGGGSSSSESSSSSSSTEAQSTPATNVKIAKEYAYQAAQTEKISAEKTIESVLTSGVKLSNITSQNDEAIVFKTQDGSNTLAIWTFELGKLNKNFTEAFDKVKELKGKTNITTTEKKELEQAQKTLANYDFKLKVNSGKAESSSVLSTSSQTALKGKNALVIDFAENGTYPGESVVDLNVGKDSANKKYMVYIITTDKNGKKNAQCLTTDLTVNGAGYARFRSSYGATYVFVPNTPENVAAKDTLAQNIAK